MIILMSDKIVFKARGITGDKKAHFVMTKVSIQKGDNSPCSMRQILYFLLFQFSQVKNLNHRNIMRPTQYIMDREQASAFKYCTVFSGKNKNKMNQNQKQIISLPD